MKSDPLPSKNPETLESMKERFSTKLTDILYEKLTVDNIETFADDALENITNLTTEIMEYYYDSNNITPNPDIEFKDQEDDAYTQLGLPKISNILDLIEEKKNEIDKIKDKIRKEYIDTVITPPQENNGGIIPGDGNGIEKKKLLPRLLTLMYILENDLEIDLENVNITEGKVYDNMMRKIPYVRVEVQDLERLVYICDEEGNASYVFDTEKLKDKRISPEDLDIDNKGDKNSLITMHPGIGVRVKQTKNWRDRVKGYLEDEIPEVGEGKNMLGEVEGFEDEKVESEFIRKEKKVFLPYKEWIQELKEAYEKDKDFKGSFDKWYRNEAGKHKGWRITSLSNIAEVYYNVAVNDIYEKIGYVKIKEKQESYLSYKEWVEQLRKAYHLADKNLISGFSEWYVNEARKHKDWYRGDMSHIAKYYNVSTDTIYSEIGYVRKMQTQESYLSYERWIKEMRDAYMKDKDFDGTFDKWYKIEAKKHKGWYSGDISIVAKKYSIRVDDIYNEIGYIRKVGLQESYLSYEKWLMELQEIYKNTDKSMINSFEKWYTDEAKKHTDWYKQKIHSVVEKYGVSVNDVYKKIGYTKKKEIVIQESYLSYEEWISELRDAYSKVNNNEINNLNKWYRIEAKKHKGWYSNDLSALAKKYNLSINDIYQAIGYTKKR